MAGLAAWPARIKGRTWFSAVVDLLFWEPEADFSPEALTGDTNPSPENAPLPVYKTVMKQFQSFEGAQSVSDFVCFMDWLARWNLEKEFLRNDLLSKTCADARRSRPDIPDIKTSELLEAEDWGYMDSLKEYLAHTHWVKDHMLCAFLENVPEEYSNALMHHWLRDGNCEDIRKKLFVDKQHPLSLHFHDPRPWNRLLHGIDRLMPEHHSGYSQKFEKLDGSSVMINTPSPVDLKGMTDGDRYKVFGRTIGFRQEVEGEKKESIFKNKKHL